VPVTATLEVSERAPLTAADDSASENGKGSVLVPVGITALSVGGVGAVTGVVAVIAANNKYHDADCSNHQCKNDAATRS
jgi:hypothetical protein